MCKTDELNCVKENQLDAQLILSMFRQPLHVSGVSRPIITRYNRMYTTVGTYYSSLGYCLLSLLDWRYSVYGWFIYLYNLYFFKFNGFQFCCLRYTIFGWVLFSGFYFRDVFCEISEYLFFLIICVYGFDRLLFFPFILFCFIQ